MRLSTGGNLIVETVTRGLQVMRFARPDLREFLDEAGETAASQLFQEIEQAVLNALPRGWILVVNLSVIEPINAAFYRCLLDIRKRVELRKGQLVLCGLSRWHREVFELFRGPDVFTIAGTEARACRNAQKRLSARAGMDRNSPRGANPALIPENNCREQFRLTTSI